jgi:hypothetical protein
VSVLRAVWPAIDGTLSYAMDHYAARSMSWAKLSVGCAGGEQWITYIYGVWWAPDTVIVGIC